MTDYITLPRSALTEELWRNPDLSCLLLFLVGKADHNGEVTVNCGELQRTFGWRRQHTRTLIAKLKATAKVTTRPTTNATTIIFDTQQHSPKHQPPSQPPTSALPGLKESPVKTTRFIKPTIDELRQHILLKGYNIDPEYFYNHYESVGWKRGNTPMKSWKATLATWNKNNFNHATTPKAQYDPRRPTDVGNHTASDYGGPF